MKDAAVSLHLLGIGKSGKLVSVDPDEGRSGEDVAADVIAAARVLARELGQAGNGA